MTYEVLMPLKAKTSEGIREIKPGEIVTLPEPEALRLLEGGRIKAYNSVCFDPQNYLLALIEHGRQEKWTDTELFAHIDTAHHTGVLTSPWGLLVHDSPLIAGGKYWLLSDEDARAQVPVDDVSFTLAEVGQLKLISTVFAGSKLIEVIRPKAKRPLNA